MLTRGKTVFTVLCLMAGGLALGVWHLLQLRFAAGDSYPPYSSLRADPLGTRALYQSLGRLPGVRAEQNFAPLARLAGSGSGTLFLAGVNARSLEELPAGEFEELEQWARQGGRLVLTLLPEPAENYYDRRRREAEEKRQAREKNLRNKSRAKEEQDGHLPKAMRLVSLKSRWGLEFKYADLKADGAGGFVPETATNAVAEAALPGALAWHSAVFAHEPGGEWRTVFARGGRPVVLERQFGQGHLVIATDSWHLSNEALRSDRQAAYLAWLVGPGQHVVFDETHLGIQSPEGVATLARKYRLHGLFAGLLLLAALFIWRNSTSLVPPHGGSDGGETESVVTGRDTAAGFVNLLRRGIPRADILQVCFHEWLQAHGRGTVREHRLERIRAVLAEEARRDVADRKPVERYAEIARILGER